MNGARAEPTPAVILATRSLGEADLLVVLLTPGRGKIRAAARHARKSRRRFPGGLSGGAVGEAIVAVRDGGLSRLEGFSPRRDHSGLGRDLTRFAYVAYVCELTDALLSEPEPDPALFTALCDAIARTMDEQPQAVVLRRYELTLLRSLGLLPALDLCAACGDPVAPGPTIPFDEERGGALCLVHGKTAARRSRAVLEAAGRLLDATAETDVDDALAAVSERPAADRRLLRDLVTAWLRRHLRQPLRSREFFTKLPPSMASSDDS
ncbi:MAG: DNA repair protein RecO [Deltaproteobacteria bacterium]|nr:DNA repair protein RecO [Deltaproteobacteria bacterium]